MNEVQLPAFWDSYWLKGWWKEEREGLKMRLSFYQVHPNSVHPHSFSVKLSAIWNRFEILSALSEHTTEATSEG